MKPAKGRRQKKKATAGLQGIASPDKNSALIVPIDSREFELYALALPRGPNFEPYCLKSTWRSADRACIGAVLVEPEARRFGAVAMRRQTDHRFAVTERALNLQTEEEALRRATAAMRPGEPAEPVPPGVKIRPLLLQVGEKGAGESFRLLTGTETHIPALMAVGEVYLAMPRPDASFASDFQTSNFDSRLWELYLLACFREQGIAVTQDRPTPDFLIERGGHECYVEAVTTSVEGGRVQGFAVPTHAPADRAERMLGPAAVRFARTLGNKLKRLIDKGQLITDKPFALAIADFHAPSSMVWSREALPAYLYGFHAEVVEQPDGRQAVSVAAEHLRGDRPIPAGLFRDPSMSYLSAVIFSNSGTLGKFNRMGFLAGYRPPGLSMVREALLFDRTPGALEPVPFKLDVLSEEYAALWPWGEAWCQELEVYHNPLATHPVAFDLLPGATHWFDRNGEIECSSMWEWSVLSSITHLTLQK